MLLFYLLIPKRLNKSLCQKHQFHSLANSESVAFYGSLWLSKSLTPSNLKSPLPCTAGAFVFLGIDMFSDTAPRILSLSQRPFTTQFGKVCCVSTSTKTPRKRTTQVAKQRWPECLLDMSSKALYGIQNQIPRSIRTCQLQNALLHFYIMPIKRLVLP
jgi:predicted RNA-binding protein